MKLSSTGIQTLECVLKRHPGIRNNVTSDCFQIRRIEPKNDACNDKLQNGHVKMKTIALSVDPYMRCMLDPDHPQLGEYLSPMELSQPLSGGGVGLVTESKHEHFPTGTIAVVPFQGYPWKTRTVLDANDRALNLRPVTFDQRPTLDLGVLGMPGVTSYFCMLSAGNPKKNDTVIVSGAAGACGSLAGQLAKRKGAHVIGICGTDEKCNVLTSYLDYDQAINYKSTTFHQDLIDAVPNGVDVYMDNVGGEISDLILPLMNPNGRVPICGQISNYNKDIKYMEMVSEEGVSDPQTRKLLKENNVDRKRFLVLDYENEWEEAMVELSQMVMNGEIVIPETIDTNTFDPGQAFVDMMNGGNIGKASYVHPDFVGEWDQERMLIRENKSDADIKRIWRW